MCARTNNERVDTKMQGSLHCQAADCSTRRIVVQCQRPDNAKRSSSTKQEVQEQHQMQEEEEQHQQRGWVGLGLFFWKLDQTIQQFFCAALSLALELDVETD